jgi:hypothetical protein
MNITLTGQYNSRKIGIKNCICDALANEISMNIRKRSKGFRVKASGLKITINKDALGEGANELIAVLLQFTLHFLRSESLSKGEGEEFMRSFISLINRVAGVSVVVIASMAITEGAMMISGV